MYQSGLNKETGSSSKSERREVDLKVAHGLLEKNPRTQSFKYTKTSENGEKIDRPMRDSNDTASCMDTK